MIFNLLLTFLLLVTETSFAKLVVNAEVWDEFQQNSKTAEYQIEAVNDFGDEDYMQEGDLRLVSSGHQGNFEVSNYQKERSPIYKKYIEKLIADQYVHYIQVTYLLNSPSSYFEANAVQRCVYDSQFGMMRYCHIDFDELILKANKNSKVSKDTPYGSKGKIFLGNLMQLLLTCPASDVVLVVTSVSESLPFFNSITQVMAEVSILSEDKGNKKKLLQDLRKRDFLAFSLGSVGGLIQDLYDLSSFMNEDEISNVSWDKFKQSKTSYLVTRALATHFYGTQGACGRAGQNLYNLF